MLDATVCFDAGGLQCLHVANGHLVGSMDGLLLLRIDSKERGQLHKLMFTESENQRQPSRQDSSPVHTEQSEHYLQDLPESDNDQKSGGFIRQITPIEPKNVRQSTQSMLKHFQTDGEPGSESEQQYLSPESNSSKGVSLKQQEHILIKSVVGKEPDTNFLQMMESMKEPTIDHIGSTDPQTRFFPTDVPVMQHHQSFMQSLNIDKETIEKLFHPPMHDIERMRRNLQVHLQQFHDEDREGMEDFFAQHYQPISGIDMKRLNLKQFVHMRRYKNSVYYGELFNHNRHGTGILVQFTEPLTIFEGQWQNNLRFGRGFQLFKNGNVYSGFFLNGKPEGFGCFYWTTKDVYTGQWVDGVKHGSGLWTGTKGDEYLGEWKDGAADGYGVHKWVNGDRYEGQFKNSLKHGNGIERFGNGDRYLGDYQNGKPCGYGEYTWANGSSYRGHFFNGLRDGKGTWKRIIEDKVEIYEGEWVNDRRVGYGTYSYANGFVYKGMFADNQRHGQGSMRTPQGEVLEGMWEWGQYIESQQKRKTGYYSRQNSPQITQRTQRQQQSQSYYPRHSQGSQGKPKMMNNFSMIREQSELEMQRSSLEGSGEQRGLFRVSKPLPTNVRKTMIVLADQQSRTARIKLSTSYNSPAMLSQPSPQRTSTFISRTNDPQPGALTPFELRRWESRAEKLKLSPLHFGQYGNVQAARKIRALLNPPVWRPAGLELKP